MTEAIWLFAALMAALVGMGWLALAYENHWQQVFPDTKSLPNKNRLQLLGWVFMVLSAVFCLKADHPSMAALVWVMLLAVATFSVAMMLSHRPAVLKIICPRLLADRAKITE